MFYIVVLGEHQDISYYGGDASMREAFIPGSGSHEMVIEATSEWLTGIYASPWL